MAEATTARDAAALSGLAHDTRWRVRRAVAGNAATTPEVLESLAHDPHPRVRLAVAVHPSCPAHTIDELAGDARRAVRARALARPELPLATIIARASSDAVAHTALVHRATDPAQHPFLLQSSVPVARAVVAASASATEGTLVRLASDRDLDVMLALCQRAHLPKRASTKLARATDWRVRRALASRHDISRRAAARLLRLNDQQAVELLVDNARIPFLAVVRHVYLAGLKRKWVTSVLAAGRNTPQLFVWLFAFSRRWQVRHALASRPDTPGFVRWKLSNDKQWSVRWALSSRPDLTHQDQERIMDMWAPQLALATNPAIAPDLALQLVEDTTRGEFIAGRALSNPAITATTLVQQARALNRTPWVLRNIAQNPNCPPELADEILTWLALGGAGDSHPMFDPITCLTHPGNREQPVFSYYQQLARTDHGLPHAPLWAARLAGARDRLSDSERLAPYARDDRVEVRRVVMQGTLSYRMWRSMAWDRDAYVRTAGIRVWRQAHFPRPKEWASSTQWLQWFHGRGGRFIYPLVLIACAAAGVAAVAAGQSPSFLAPGFGILMFRMARRGKQR
jgi:hypothetical protein